MNSDTSLYILSKKICFDNPFTVFQTEENNKFPSYRYIQKIKGLYLLYYCQKQGLQGALTGEQRETIDSIIDEIHNPSELQENYFNKKLEISKGKD
jgi:hypothetical protein